MWNRTVIIPSVLLLIGVFAIGYAISEQETYPSTAISPDQIQSEEKADLASKPHTTEPVEQIGLPVAPQVTISEFKAETTSISNDCAATAVIVSTLMDNYGTGQISKQQFLQGMTEAENYLSSLLDKTRELGDKSMDILYPGEESHLATYLDLAVGEFYLGVKAIKEGAKIDDARKVDQGNLLIEQATKDITKFKQGLSQL